MKIYSGTSFALVIFFITAFPPVSLAQTQNTTCPQITAFLQKGIRHPQVLTLKLFLGAQGLLTDVSNTNYFGENTETALKAWQKKNTIEPVGVTGPKTRAALKNCMQQSAAPLPVSTVVNSTAGSVQYQQVTLRLGMRNEAVLKMQTALIALKLLPADAATGFFGPLTRAAVQTFQRQNGIVATGDEDSTGYGAVGPKTRIKLATANATVVSTIATSDVNIQVNGILPITNENVVVTAQPPAIYPTQSNTCTFNGLTIAHGSSVTAYQNSNDSIGSVCASQLRTCKNGALSGTYTHARCTSRLCTNPNPEVVTKTCKEAGYPDSHTGSYVSTRQLDCKTGLYSDWVRNDTCKAPVFTFSAPNNSIDFRKYWPNEYTSVVARKYDGTFYSDYRFYPLTGGKLVRGTNIIGEDFYKTYFDLKKPGYPYQWEKRYGEARTMTPTIAFIFMGDDLSVTEVGDFYGVDGATPSVAFGYSTNSTAIIPSGLLWSGIGGLKTASSNTALTIPKTSLIENLVIARQQKKLTEPYALGDAQAWSELVVMETLPTYTPPYGRSATGVWGKGNGREYKDVIRVILYHGTRLPGHNDFTCASSVKPEYASLYRTKPGYHTYAMEFYFAPGKGRIQEAFLYTEDGSYWKQPNCQFGTIFKNNPNTLELAASYIDEGNLQCAMPAPTITAKTCQQAGYDSSYSSGSVTTVTQLDCYTNTTMTNTYDLCRPAVCTNPAPQVVTSLCEEVGYPAGSSGSYISTRQLDCKTGLYSDWIRTNTCKAPTVSCTNPAPQVVTNTCKEVGYPAHFVGSYISERQMNCATGLYSDWIRKDTCKAPN